MKQRSPSFFAAAIFLFLLFSLQPARASTWNNSVVDNTATTTGKNLSLAVDPSGKLHIGYLDTSSAVPILKYANNAGGSWSLESLQNILPDASNASTATVYTPGGPRVMAYSKNSTTTKNMYRAARKVTGDGWQLQDIAGGISPLDGSIQPAMGTTIATATQTGSTQYMGFTYITYNDGNKLWYANEKDMAWYNISNAGTSAGNAGVQSDLVVDSSGNVHVVYADAKGNIYYAKNPTAPGQATLIATDPSIWMANPSIAIDSANNIHVVFTYPTNQNGSSYVKYVKKPAGGSWPSNTAANMENVGVSGKSGGYTTLKTDSANNIHVAWYRSSSTSGLIYREKPAAGTWAAAGLTEEVVVPTYGQYAAMAIDQNNNVNIAYYNTNTTSLNVITKATPAIDVSPSTVLFGYVPQYATSAPQTVTITNKGNDGVNGNLTINTIGAPSQANFSVVSNGCTPLPKTLAVGASCAISYQFAPTIPGEQTATVSIASNDPNIPTKTLTLKGSTTNTGNHTITAGTTGPGGTISPAGAVSVANGVNQTFTITPDPGYLVAMVAVDPTGMTPPEMMAASKGALTSYTFNEVTADHGIYVMFTPYASVSTWNTTEVDNNATATGKNLSIAVDPANKLHIGYLDTTGAAPYLKYANNAGGSWTLESLTNILPDAFSASTATVFTPGGPRIMAYSYNSTTLKYMYRAARKVTGDGWQLQDIGGGISPLDSSIQPAMTAVNPSTQTGSVQYMGFTFITYNDGAKLWYANERDMQWYNISAAGSAAGNGGIQSDLALDSSGNVHVVYVDALNNLLYAKNPTAPGQATTIQNPTGAITNPSIAITADNTLHVIYLDATDSTVKYIKSITGGASWSTVRTVGSVGTSTYGGYLAIKADNMGGIHITYYYGSSTTNGLLMYNHILPSGAWGSTEIIPDPNASANYGQHSAIAIDNNNIVNIAYYDVTRSSLKIATKQTFGIDATPSPLYFGNVNQGSHDDNTVTVTNKGTATNLKIRGSATIGGDNASDFTISNNTCTDGLSIAPGAEGCNMTVRFSPTAPGARTATLIIGSDDLLIPYKSVPLSGTSNASGNYTITAGVIDFNMQPTSVGGTISPAGAMTVAGSDSQTFTITPDPGFLVANVIVDNVPKGALTSYTFNQVTANHSIYVMFMPYVSVSTWSTTEVDNTGTATGTNLSMAIDPANKLHIGYLDTTNSSAPYLKYATNTGGSWSLTSLKDILPNAMSASTATVYTPGGPRVMAYSFDSSTSTYRYQAARKLIGNGWQLQDIGGGISPLDGSTQPTMTTVAASTQTGALQYMGSTFITFNNGSYLQYANERDMAWNKISNAGSAEGNAGAQSDLAIDSSGNIHVVYVDALNNLLYAKNPTLPGQATTIQNPTGVITNPSIAIDANNTLHVIYLDATNYTVKYTTLVSGGAWTTPRTVGSVGSSSGGYLAIKADNIGGVHITYYFASNSTKGLLMYHHILPSGAFGSDEIIKDPNTSTNYGKYSAIAIDNNNIVNIAYYDAIRSSLKVATKQTFGIDATPSPLYFGNAAQGSSTDKTVTVTNKGTAGTLKIKGNPTLSGANASEFLITGNTCYNGFSMAPGSDSCTVTVHFAPTSPGAKTATLTIGSDDLLIPYKSVPLSGTSNTSTNYTITAGAGIGGTISPAGAVTVAGSNSQTFTFTPDPGYVVAMVAVDPAGQTQQDMVTASQGALTSYTFNQVTANHGIYVMFMQAIPVTSWNIVEVDNSASVTGQYCSITNDSNSKLHVGYLDTTSATVPLLKYATNKSGSWVYETVSTIPSITAAGTATVFSEGIGPRVMAYSYNSGTGARKYGAARKWTETAPSGGNLNDWQLQWVAGDYFPAQYGGGAQPPINSISTDTFTGATQFNGYTFITYADGNNLWYANEKDFYYLKLNPTQSIAGAGKQSDLVLDTASNIHIVYYTPGTLGTGELRYGSGQGSSSSGYTESVLVTGVTSDPSITMDGNNTLHVSYIKSGRVYYLNKPFGGSWSATPYDIGPCGANGAYTSIKANGLNIIHLTYYAYNSANASGKLMYVTRSATGSWSTPQAVTDSSANVGQYAALTVDMHHNVNIAYHDVSRTSLKVASRLIPVVSAPSSVNFGTVAANTDSDQTITVSNVGQDTLRIGTATLDGVDASKFSIFANTCNNTTLSPGGAGCTVTVRFSSASEGTKTAKLHITSNDRYTPDQQITLSATVSPLPTHSISTSVNTAAGTHGLITPSGIFNVPSGGSQDFLFSMDSGFFITDVKVDGVTNDDAKRNRHYVFTNVTAPHTLAVTFESNVMVGTNFIGSIQAAAWEAANHELPIKARIHIFTEYLLFDLPTNIIFGGGYNSAFTSQDGGATVIMGTLEIRDGGIEAQNIGMAPPPN